MKREGSMVVREIDLADAAAVGRFIAVPFALYRGVPQWTPPVEMDLRRQLSLEKNAFFRHSQAGFFLVERDGQALGRIAALRHRFYNEKHQNDTGFFYLFESVDDDAVAAALFGAAETWARARGLRRMLGPVGFIQPDPPGILVRGFEHEGTVNVPWHFPYYERLVMAAGFAAHTDYLSGYFDRRYPYPHELIAQAAAVQERGGYTVRSFGSARAMRAWVQTFFDTYLEAFREVPDFYPMSPAEFAALAGDMLMIMDPATTRLLEQNGQVIGFLLSVRDVTPGLRRARGRLLPLGWWHLLRSRAASRQCNVIALGVLPRHQKGGANLVLFAELVKTLHASRFERAEIVQIVGTNLNTHGDMTRLGAKWDKCHRVYRRELTAGEGGA